MPDGQVTLPYTLVSGDSLGDHNTEWQATNSPFYKLLRSSCYANVGFTSNQTDIPTDTSWTLDTGFTNEQSETFSHSAGISIAAEGGVEILGTGGKATVTVNYQFGYSHETSRSEMASTSNAIVLHTPVAHAGVIWALQRSFNFMRLDGSRIGSDMSYKLPSTITDQFPKLSGQLVTATIAVN
jgi:hypothetical protein